MEFVAVDIDQIADRLALRVAAGLIAVEQELGLDLDFVFAVDERVPVILFFPQSQTSVAVTGAPRSKMTTSTVLPSANVLSSSIVAFVAVAGKDSAVADGEASRVAANSETTRIAFIISPPMFETIKGHPTWRVVASE